MEETKESRRNQIIKEVHAVMNSECKPDENDFYFKELELKLAGLFPEWVDDMAVTKLFKEDFEAGGEFRGFLYNKAYEKYVSTKDLPWLYASANYFHEGILWTMKKRDLTYLEMKTLAGLYLNWRNITGACKLYDSYDKIILHWCDNYNDLFYMECVDCGQIIGTWDKPSNSPADSELYVRKRNECRNFEFHMIDTAKLSDDDKLIYAAYCKYGALLNKV